MSTWVDRHCSCGASLRGRSTPASLSEGLAEIFDTEHAGDGHEPVTSRQAARARAKNDEAARVQLPFGGSDA